jgi:Uncharacterised nucleotidyltransferase/Transglutaminase-like superfamily
MPSQSPSSIEKFVMGDHNAPITAAALVQARLAGYAYRMLPEEHHLREELRNARRNLEIQHQLVKNQLKPLLKAWSDAGIKVMLIKGFWLAEFIYERPGDRGYGDIDVLVPEEEAQEAIQLARDAGWSVTIERKTSGNQNSHEEAHIVSNDGLGIIDLHRFALQSARSWGQHHPKRLTEAFWASATQQHWEGANIWLLSPLDGFILNLLNRARGDHWSRRASDLLDAKALVQQGNFSLEQIKSRASELHVRNSIQAALSTCNPWKNYIYSVKPGNLQRIILDFKTAQEIGLFDIEQSLFFLSRAINAVTGLPIMLPIIFRVQQALRHQLDLYQIFQSLEKHYLPNSNANEVELVRLKRSAHLALYLFGRHRDTCVPRSMALYLALRQRNFPVQFVSGIRRENGKLTGHAWLEYKGRPLENLGDQNAPEIFKENFRYPS